MEENLNNNEVSNNQLPNNDYYEPKKNGVKILLVILIILLLVLIGIFSYKFFVLDKKDAKEENNKVEEKVEGNKENETISEYASIADYIKNSNASYSELMGASHIETSSIEETKCDGSSFKITNNGLNIEAKCVKSREDELGIEYTYDITAKNNTTIKISRGCYSCGCSNLYSNSNYIIKYYSGCSANGQSIEIYNINDGKKIYYGNYYNDGSVVKPHLATSSRESDDSEDFTNHGIIFSNNKLYYVLADSYDQTKCRLMMADLSSDKFVETEIDSMDCYY